MYKYFVIKKIHDTSLSCLYIKIVNIFKNNKSNHNTRKAFHHDEEPTFNYKRPHTKKTNRVKISSSKNPLCNKPSPRVEFSSPPSRISFHLNFLSPREAYYKASGK